VQAVLKRQAGVRFAPKDLRSSFITFLLSDANSDEALKKGVAHAICATSRRTAGLGGVRQGPRRAHVWAAAVQGAGAFAARFE